MMPFVEEAESTAMAAVALRVDAVAVASVWFVVVAAVAAVVVVVVAEAVGVVACAFEEVEWKSIVGAAVVAVAAAAV